jgi:hypothetical protein
MALTVAQYDALERAIVDARRIAVQRRGTEFLVIPERLVLRGGREAILARHPTTGAALELLLDECDAIEVIR